MQVKKINLDKKNISWLALITLLAGCHDIDSHPALNGSKALVKVNGDEISLNQFNMELNRAHFDKSVDKGIKDKLLSKIIDRQLLVQEATKLNLDRVPEVVEAVNSAKAQIYAEAYLANRISKLPPPSDEAITQYIDAHPDICAHRKVFSTKDVVFNYEPVATDLKVLQTSVADIESLQAYLEAKSIQYNVTSGHFSMDALPSVWAEKLKTAKVGHLLFAHDNTNVIVKSITSITENPMSADEAKDFASKALFENKKQTFLTNEVSRLRKLSTINILDSNMALTTEKASSLVGNQLSESSGKP